MWTKESVDKRLSLYAADKARAEHIRVEIGYLEQVIADLEKSIFENVAAISAQVITGMPHGGGTSDPTASAALRLAAGWEGNDIEQLKAEKRELKEELKIKEQTVRYVEAWLKGLTEREAWLIQKQVVNGEFWRDIIDDYARVYQVRVSQDTLSRIKAKAMGKIYRAAGIPSELTNK